MQPCAVIIDNRPDVINDVTRLLPECGLKEAGSAVDSRSGLELLCAVRPTVAVVGENLSKGSSLKLIRKARALGCLSRFVFITEFPSVSTLHEARDAGVPAAHVQLSLNVQY